MRRTRHLALPVRSFQYVGLLIVSLACVTFGLVAQDKEGKHGSLTGPEMQHIAPHNVDTCPNKNPYTDPKCQDSTEIDTDKISSSTNENEVENLSQNTRISAENRHRSRSRFLSMVSPNRRSSQSSRDDSRRYRENSRIRRSREEEIRSRSARSRSLTSLDRSRTERIQVQRFRRTREMEKSKLPGLDSRRRARSVDFNRDNRRNNENRRGSLRENRQILESSKNYSGWKMIHFETLKQAVIITLCAVYGTSVFNRKQSFVRNLPEWMRLSIV